jgi:uncharacterized RDD family membrane protein YckC
LTASDGPAAAEPLDTLCPVETPEGITLELSPAGPVPRALAFLVDFVIRFALWVICLLVANPLGALGTAFAWISLFLIEWIYPIVFELSMGGATPGKRALGLQVVMQSGLPVTPAASVTRNLLRTADFLPALYAFGALALLLRSDFKRLGDMAAGTLVVHAAAVSLYREPPEAVPAPPARPLSLREQSAIVSWAERAATLTPARLEELARLAQPAAGVRDGADAGSEAQADVRATAALLGVARWLVGYRAGEQP